MGDLLTVEPFGFFTLESARAGWYVTWRQLVRVVPVMVGALLVGSGLGALGMGVLAALIITLGVIGGAVWGLVLLPRLASQWAAERYGYPLTGMPRVWWGIFWRVFVASAIVAVILTPPSFVALSLATAFKGSVLGMLGHTLTALIWVAYFGVAVVATGWAVSRVTAMQLTGLPVVLTSFAPALEHESLPVGDPVEAFGVAAESVVAAPVAVATPAIVAAPIAAAPPPMPATMPAPVAAPAPPHVAAIEPLAQAERPARAPAAAEGKRQCPKCGLYETERGTVIGWYCTICGWRESRR